jgi:serine/threonine protein kinase
MHAYVHISPFWKLFGNCGIEFVCPFRGEFGDLCKCQEVTTDREFVTKVITTETAEQKTRAMQEFEMHRQLSHPRVTKLEDAFSNDNQLLLVME